jgi:UDP-perosamine 4-acetyltransferase
LQQIEEFTPWGVLEANFEFWGKTILGVPVLGDDDKLPGLLLQGVKHFILGLGSTANSEPRRLLFQKACQAGLTPVTIMHPQAIVSPNATLGKGTAVLAGAIINAGAKIGENVIINTGAIVEHDCIIDHHGHIAIGARLAGEAVIGEGSHIGMGACILQGVKIGERAIVGAGAVVLKDVPQNTTAVGVPAKIIKLDKESINDTIIITTLNNT